MEDKLKEPISQVRGWVNGRIAIVVACLYSRMISVDCLPSPIQYQDPDWDSGSGIGLAQ